MLKVQLQGNTVSLVRRELIPWHGIEGILQWVVKDHAVTLLGCEINLRTTLPDNSVTYCTLQYIYSQTVVGKIMATEKTTTLTFRIEPNIKQALCTAADRDHRSIANMVAMMIREHCARVGIPIQDKPTPDTLVKAKPKTRK